MDITEPRDDATPARIPTPLPHSPAADRNRDAILAVLASALPARGRVLEIASGTGQHVLHFAAALPGLVWQPTDLDAAAVDAIARRLAAVGPTSGLTSGLAQGAGDALRERIQPPRRLDVRERPWALGPFDALVCINMIHIAPWAAGEALFDGAAEALRPGAAMVLYGPYLQADVPTAESNLAFDRSLRARDPAWGLRDRDTVVARAAAAGFVHRRTVAMPANNLSLVFERG